jgi:ribosomal protein L6P/L9E
LGVIKVNIKAVNLINFYRLSVFYFDETLVNLIKNKISYLTSVGDFIKKGIINICKGYSCYVRIKGVGYKIEQKVSNYLTITIGYSHKVNIKLPNFIKIHILKKRIII